MELSPQFKKNIEAVYGERGSYWLQRLPESIHELECLWDLSFIKPVHDLSFNFVALVTINTTKEKAVLKMAPSGEHLIRETRCLLSFSHVTPKIYQHDEGRFAFLMEFIEPGYSLKTFLKNNKDSDVTRIISKTIIELQQDQQKQFEFKHLSELVKDLDSLRGYVNTNVLEKAQSLFRDLTQDRSRDVILHGDLHHDNIIRCGSGWKVIDPHGYLGDPAAEVGVMIRNPMDAFPSYCSPAQIVETRLNILKEELPFDPQRIKAWAFIMTILSAAWNMIDFNQLADSEIELAGLIDRVRL